MSGGDEPVLVSTGEPAGGAQHVTGEVFAQQPIGFLRYAEGGSKKMPVKRSHVDILFEALLQRCLSNQSR